MRARILVVVLCSIIDLNGMQLPNKKLTLQDAMGLINQGQNLVVYYNDGEKPTINYSQHMIKEFRKNQLTGKRILAGEHITDFVMSGALQSESKRNNVWSEVPKSIQAIINTKSGLGYYPCGFVIYTTQCDKQWSFERYMTDLESLRKAQVPVIIYTHSKQVAENIFHQSSIDREDKSLLINGSLVLRKKYDFENFSMMPSNILIFGMIFIGVVKLLDGILYQSSGL